MEKFGNVVDEAIQRVEYEGKCAWERILRLHIKPKPKMFG